MKKKVKDLTIAECKAICGCHEGQSCKACPLGREVIIGMDCVLRYPYIMSEEEFEKEVDV